MIKIANGCSFKGGGRNRRGGACTLGPVAEHIAGYCEAQDEFIARGPTLMDLNGAIIDEIEAMDRFPFGEDRLALFVMENLSVLGNGFDPDGIA